MVLLQHLYGIKLLQQTVKETDMNIAYRWFIGYDIDTPVPHFATIRCAFATRFSSKVSAEIFAWILEAVIEKGFMKAEKIFIDAPHFKANSNRKKHCKELAAKAARVYDKQLREKIEAERHLCATKTTTTDHQEEAEKSGCRQPTRKAGCFTRESTKWSLHIRPVWHAMKTTSSSAVK